MLTSEAISPDKVQAIGRTIGSMTLGSVQSVRWQEQDLLILAERGSLVIRVLPRGMIRIKLFPGTAGAEAIFSMQSTVAIVPQGNPEGLLSEVQLREEGDKYTLSTSEVLLSIGKQDGGISFMSHSRQFITDQAPLAWDESMEVTGLFTVGKSAHFYGLGEKTGALDKKGERYEMWNSDVYAPHVPEIEALYQSIPLLVVHEDDYTYGLFLDNPGRTFFDMRSNSDSLLMQTETGSMDYYFIPGPDMKSVVSRYTTLTGRMELPPHWALGYHQSRYSYMSQEEVLELARTFREKQIPCDVIYLDIHYMDGYRVFTFDPQRFPDPKGMIAELKSLGIRIVPIVDPGVKLDMNYPVFKEGTAHGYFCVKPDGQPFVGPVWPGMSVFPDFTEDEAAEWWGDLHRFYTEMGIEGIWNDMNEPAVFNPSMTMDLDTMHSNNGNPVNHGEIHNLYGLLMSKSTAEGMKRNLNGHRPFVLTRAGYAGIQRYAAVWTGDNRSFWEHMAMSIPMVLNLGLSGIAFAGPDIGGFAHHTSGELLVRWTQMGSLFPYCRNHSELRSIRQEPWCFGPEVEEICREYIGLRYRLLPLIYSLFREAAETGLPVIRPLVLEYPDDSHVTNLCDQFLLGEQLLAAPVYRPGTTCRAVYLPAGTWIDYWSGQSYEGGQHILADAPLERLPLYVKAGAIVPHQPVVESTIPEAQTELTAQRELTIDMYCSGKESTGRFELYEDDGLTLEYEEGEGAYNLHRILLEESEGTVRVYIHTLHTAYASPRELWRIRFKHLPGKPEDISIKLADENNSFPASGDLKSYYDEAEQELTVWIPRPVENLELRLN